ncbi:MAG: hypothetical protein M1821_009304 [Bathelium mastoideum]|nr:MAG: hypothetical protein M1821_009304 [Bathelium mastoideum]
MCKGYYDTFSDCIHGHLIRTSIVYCPNSVHSEGEKERHVPCERFDDAAEYLSEFSVADYPCPKCTCTEQEYLPESGRPWERARERIFSQISGGVLRLVYGNDYGKIRESEARVERLRTVVSRAAGAQEYAAMLERELAGKEHRFQDRARRLAQEVRRDLENMDPFRMRMEAARLAQQLRNKLHATDEGAIDMWEHMDYCLEKETTSRANKSKRLKVFSDEKERIESEEGNKPEPYRIPKVELIYDWDHSQQGRPSSKKSQAAPITFPKDTNPRHFLPRLANHMKFDIPTAHQAYEARTLWTEAQKRKRSRSALEQDNEVAAGNKGKGPQSHAQPPPVVALQYDVGPAPKRRRPQQTNRGRRDGASAGRGKRQRIAARTSQPQKPIKQACTSPDPDLGTIFASPPGRSTDQPSAVPAAPFAFGATGEDGGTAPLESLLQTGRLSPQESINEPDFAFLDPEFASTPAPILSSTGAILDAGTGYSASPKPTTDISLVPPEWPTAHGDGDIGSGSGSVAPGGGAMGIGAQQSQRLHLGDRVQTDPSAYHANRASPFHSPYQALNTYSHSMSHAMQMPRSQVRTAANPRIAQVQGGAGPASRPSPRRPNPRQAGPARLGTFQASSPLGSYGHQAPGYPAPPFQASLPSGGQLAHPNLSSPFLPSSANPFHNLASQTPSFPWPSSTFPTSYLRNSPPPVHASPQADTNLAPSGAIYSPMLSLSSPLPPTSSPTSAAPFIDLVLVDLAAKAHPPLRPSDEPAGQALAHTQGSLGAEAAANAEFVAIERGGEEDDQFLALIMDE